MKTVRRTKIRLEKHELTTIRFSRKARFFCADCQTQVNHLTVAQAANALAVSEKNIFRLAENGQIHSTETADGKLMICTAFEINNEQKITFIKKRLPEQF